MPLRLQPNATSWFLCFSPALYEPAAALTLSKHQSHHCSPLIKVTCSTPVHPEQALGHFAWSAGPARGGSPQVYILHVIICSPPTPSPGFLNSSHTDLPAILCPYQACTHLWALAQSVPLGRTLCPRYPQGSRTFRCPSLLRRHLSTGLPRPPYLHSCSPCPCPASLSPALTLPTGPHDLSSCWPAAPTTIQFPWHEGICLLCTYCPQGLIAKIVKMVGHFPHLPLSPSGNEEMAEGISVLFRGPGHREGILRCSRCQDLTQFSDGTACLGLEYHFTSKTQYCSGAC